MRRVELLKLLATAIHRNVRVYEGATFLSRKDANNLLDDLADIGFCYLGNLEPETDPNQLKLPLGDKDETK